MAKKQLKRELLVEQLAKHVLERGLEDCGLRRLAEVTGTSDRMLLYYFQSKDALLSAVLSHISAGLTRALTAAFGSRRMSPAEALRMLWLTMKDEAMAPQLRLWLDLSSRASRGDPLCVGVVEQISAEWISWTSGILDLDPAQRTATATLLMAAMDGQAMIFPNDLVKGDQAIELLCQLLEQRRGSR